MFYTLNDEPVPDDIPAEVPVPYYNATTDTTDTDDTDDTVNTVDTDMPPAPAPASFLSTMTTTTENGALSLPTTQSARVDLFFKLTRDVVVNPAFDAWFDASWTEDPLDTMKLTFNSRDCRGGKGDRAPFLYLMRKISEEHPAWFAANIHNIAEYGRWLDVVDLATSLSSASHRAALQTLISEQLARDVADMRAGNPVSLLAKWFPSEGKKFDKGELLNVVGRAFSGGSSKKIRKTLRTEVITPLRAYLNVVERFICAGEWDAVEYSKVPSVAMLRLRKAFARHSPERFAEWLENVKNGTSKINASQVYPHELVRTCLDLDQSIDEVVEAQWTQLVENTRELGTLSRSLAVVDVSGSMYSFAMPRPVDVAISLGILIASVTTPPFDNLLLTFSSIPEFHAIGGHASLHAKVTSVKNMDWGMNTDFEEVFSAILKKGLANRVPPSDMPTRIYVISDMQFDEAVGNSATNFQAVRNMYDIAGYEFPEIVFWNVRSKTTSDFPVRDTQTGVALLSGYSPSIMKSVLTGTTMTPYSVMRETIDDPRYDRIVSPV